MESTLEKYYIKILLRLEKAGRCKFFKLKNEEKSGNHKLNILNKQQGVVKGAPDLLIIAPKGKCFFIEFKDIGKNLRKEQLVLKKDLLDNFLTEVVVVNEYKSFTFLDVLDRYNITDSLNNYPFEIYF